MNSARYLVPNSCTATSMLFGLASVASSAQGSYDLAAWMILWGVLLDKLDGVTARLMKATSEFGMQFDSFADFVVFGIAPGALIYFKCSNLPRFQTEWGSTLLLVAVGLFIVATSVRLARFNIISPPDGDSIFYGIPTTLVGAILASGYLTCSVYGLGEQYIELFPVYLVIGAAAMVSQLRLPKLKGRKNPFVHWFQIINIVGVYTLTPFKVFPEYLLSLCAIYVSIGLTWGLLNPASDDLPSPTEGAV